jgi:dCTP deaminase
MTLGNEFSCLKPDFKGPIDPRNPPDKSCYDFFQVDDNNSFRLEPGQFVLACTKEYVKVPDTTVSFLMDKSTLARFGVFLFNTIFEPGWEGIPTVEVVNFNKVPILLHPGMGICQFIFAIVNKPTKDYLEKSGKYQGQIGVTVAR